jgi:hypothetical protein
VQDCLRACLRQGRQEPDARTRILTDCLLAKLGDLRIEVLDPLRIEFCVAGSSQIILRAVWKSACELGQGGMCYTSSHTCQVGDLL